MNLRSLSRESGARFEAGTFDLRGWEVRLLPEEDRVGVIDDVLVDDRGRTRYLAVELDGRERHVLIPSGHADAEEASRVVWLSGFGSDELSRAPEYDHHPDRVDADYERRLGSVYGESDEGARYYDRPDFRASWGRGKNTTSSGTLSRLDQLEDIDVAGGDPDPRGWEVVDSGGRRIGKVHHLIGDLEAMKVRYLTVELDGEVVSGRGEVLIPVGHLDLDRNQEQVRTSLDRRQISELPAYGGGEITREHERTLISALEGAYADERRYDHPRYRHQGLYGDGPEDSVEPEPQGVVVRRWRWDANRLEGMGDPSREARRREATSRRR